MSKKFVVGTKGIDDYTVTTIRIEKKLIEEYDKLSGKSGYSRNELICRALQYALENLEFTDHE